MMKLLFGAWAKQVWRWSADGHDIEETEKHPVVVSSSNKPVVIDLALFHGDRCGTCPAFLSDSLSPTYGMCAFLLQQRCAVHSTCTVRKYECTPFVQHYRNLLASIDAQGTK